MKCPDEHWPLDEDLKQMLVYKLYYHADEAILLYPSADVSYNTKGRFKNELHYTVHEKNTFAISEKLKLGCGMGFLSLLTKEKLLTKSEFQEKIKLSLLLG